MFAAGDVLRAARHILTKEAAEFSNRNHMQLQHEVNAFHTRLAVRIEEEHPRIVDKHIHLQAVLLAIIEQIFRCGGQAEVGIVGNSLHAKIVVQLLRYLLQLGLLVAD